MFPLIHGWTDVQRSPGANLRLGLVLSFVAGATNAGGFLAVGRYTSHMTGIVSSVADDVVLGHLDLALAGLACLVAFLLGAMCTAIMVNWGLRQHLRSSYSLPLMLESVALLVFGLFGAAIAAWSQVFLPVTVVLLCFIMGLQNAVITKISKAEIRTTHITGLVTDIGIELGKWVYLNRLHEPSPVRANRERLRIQTGLVMGFLLGGLLGAMGFKHWGYVTTVPLAGLLWLLSLRPLLDDLRQRAA
ncbi:YoaK family protein [Limnohabitans parvus]|uniref:DUF1275 family protein n=1 Tax=Limnohabitans parvus II-B4 TaxID=1293052 RepID=A0A315E7F2_9BURK|nr:YoaK family protein [Limnohabitans parvus]PUE52172.1 hypothetical protein B9Z37_14005 [Limnohabitans parvus II-B4]